jgi:hypothetical protein
MRLRMRILPPPPPPLLLLLVAFAVHFITPTCARDGSYRALVSRMRSACESNTRICSMATISSMFGLGSQGMCGDAACEQHVMRIGCSAPALPHVFVSGALHGDERLGPIATTEFGAMLIRQYNRSSWSTRIVDSRCIVLFPVANAMGYFMRQREDNGVDPNR